MGNVSDIQFSVGIQTPCSWGTEQLSSCYGARPSWGRPHDGPRTWGDMGQVAQWPQDMKDMGQATQWPQDLWGQGRSQRSSAHGATCSGCLWTSGGGSSWDWFPSRVSRCFSCGWEEDIAHGTALEDAAQPHLQEGSVGELGECFSLSTPVVFPQPQLPFAIHYSGSRTVGDLHWQVCLWAAEPQNRVKSYEYPPQCKALWFFAAINT